MAATAPRPAAPALEFPRVVERLGLVDLPVRECGACGVFTQLGACPDCRRRLGEPPYAVGLPAGVLDAAPYADRPAPGTPARPRGVPEGARGRVSPVGEDAGPGAQP